MIEDDYLFLHDEYFGRFLEAARSRSSISQRKNAMRTYITFYRTVKKIEVTPTMLLERIKKDRERDLMEAGLIEEEWNEYVSWLGSDYHKYDVCKKVTKKNPSPMTIRVYASTIKSFYSFFNYQLGKKAKLPIKVSKSAGNIANEKIPYRPKEVKRLVSAISSSRDRAIALIMFQSGMDISTTISLRYSHVKKGLLDHDCPLRIFIKRPKTGISFRTFIGKDAIESLELYIKERTYPKFVCESCGHSWMVKRYKCTICKGRDIKKVDGKLTDESPLFVREYSNEAILPPAFQRALRRYVQLAGLVSEEEMSRSDRNPARSHALRTAFASILRMNGANEALIDYFMGHTERYGGAYNRMTDEELKEQYVKYEEYLSISEFQDVEGVVEQFKRELKQRDEIIGKMEARLTTLEESLKIRTRSMAGDLADDHLGDFAEITETIEADEEFMEKAREKEKEFKKSV